MFLEHKVRESVMKYQATYEFMLVNKTNPQAKATKPNNAAVEAYTMGSSRYQNSEK